MTALFNRRAFTFASLASAAYAATARAGEPAPQELRSTPPANAAPPAHGLQPRWNATIANDVLTVTLAVTNTAKDPVQLLVARGSTSSTAVCASLLVDDKEVPLAEVLPAPDPREYMSRMGPMPRYAEVSRDGAEVALGSFQFTLPKGSAKERIRVTATLLSGVMEEVGPVFTHDFEGALLAG